MIHWGIVGPGVIANAFAKGMFGCKDANLLAVASSDQLRAETFARQYNVPHWFSSYEQLFSLKEIDVVYIANLNPQHEATIRQALLHDKHVLCEKPLTLNSEQSRELFSIAEKRGLFLMEAYWTACLPTYRKAKQWIERGLIGQLKSIQVSFCFKAEYHPQSRLFNKELGGGALYDLGIYGIGLALDFFSAYPKHIDTEIQYAESGVDQYANLLLDFGDSRFAQLEFGFTEDKEQNALILGTENTLILPDFWHGTEIIRMQHNNKILESQTYPHAINGYEYEIQEVCNCIKSGQLTSLLVPPQMTIHVAQLIKEVLSLA